MYQICQGVWLDSKNIMRGRGIEPEHFMKYCEKKQKKEWKTMKKKSMDEKAAMQCIDLRLYL